MWEINKNNIADDMYDHLKKTASDNFIKKDNNLIKAIELLNSSAEKLEQFGFEKEAELLTRLTILAVKGDPHTEHLTYEKMVNNLEHKGTMFDANDSKDHKPTHEGPDEYKREKLEEEYLEEMLDSDYDKILGDLDDEQGIDEVII